MRHRWLVVVGMGGMLFACGSQFDEKHPPLPLDQACKTETQRVRETEDAYTLANRNLDVLQWKGHSDYGPAMRKKIDDGYVVFRDAMMAAQMARDAELRCFQDHR